MWFQGSMLSVLQWMTQELNSCDCFFRMLKVDMLSITEARREILDSSVWRVGEALGYVHSHNRSSFAKTT